MQLFVLLISAGALFPLGLNVKEDFGAKGDGITDDTAALQTALDTSQSKSRALLFPAGVYRITRTLRVQCTKNASGHTVRGPVNLVGEGSEVALISAEVAMEAVLEFDSSAAPPKYLTTNGHHVRGLGFKANTVANHSVRAEAITRSHFDDLYVFGARRSGMYLGFGWENVVSNIHFHANGGAALHLESSVNAVQVLRNNFETGEGIGILVNCGVAVQIEGNTLESQGGPAIVANAVQSLSIHSNYFEANNAASEGSSVRFNNGSSSPLSVCADVVLDAVPLANISLPNVTLGASYRPCAAVIISGNYHNPAQAASWCTRYSGIAAYGAGETIVEANRCAACAKYNPSQRCTLLSGASAEANATSFRISMNSGWD
jgi:hypothetical protein